MVRFSAPTGETGKEHVSGSARGVRSCWRIPLPSRRPPMRRSRNARTQPFRPMPVFNNWDVVAKAWYVAMRSADLKTGQARSMDVCGQWIVLYRGEDGRVRALDGYCPHMGTDLGIGTVVGDRIR